MSDDETIEKPVNRGNAGKGRPKGSRNKTTLAAKEAILLAGEGLGGVDGLVAWAKSSKVNLRLFWTAIYPKVLPIKEKSGVEAATLVTGALVWERPAPPMIEAAATLVETTVVETIAAPGAVPVMP